MGRGNKGASAFTRMKKAGVIRSKGKKQKLSRIQLAMHQANIKNPNRKRG
jgi:hypothetical protein